VGVNGRGPGRSIDRRAVSRSLPMKSAGPLDRRCFDSSQIFTKYRSHPLHKRGANAVRVCRVAVTMMGKLHLQVIRDVDIFVLACASSSRLAVGQLKAAFARSRGRCKNARVIIVQ